MDKVKVVQNSGAWEQFRAELLEDPEAREEYERTRRSVTELRRILQTVESERQQAGLSKADLARRVGVEPAAIRRLLTSETSNPTFRTMLGIFDALGLQLTLTPTKRARVQGRTRASAARDGAAVS